MAAAILARVLTIFTIPKPFVGHIGEIQLNALESCVSVYLDTIKNEDTNSKYTFLVHRIASFLTDGLHFKLYVITILTSAYCRDNIVEQCITLCQEETSLFPGRKRWNLADLVVS